MLDALKWGAAVTLTKTALITIALGLWTWPAISLAQPTLENLPRRAEPIFAPRKLTLFADLTSSERKDRRPTYRRDDDILQPQLGAVIRVAPQAAITVGGSYNRLTGRKTFPEIGDYKMTGATVFAGGTVYVGQNYALNLTGGLVRNDVVQDRRTATSLVTEKHKLNGEFVSLNADANYLFSSSRISLFARYLHYSGREPASVDSAGVRRDAFNDSFDRLAIGAEAYKRIGSGPLSVEPMVRLAFLYDPNLPRFYRDRSAFELGAGVNLSSGPTTVALRVFSTVGHQDYKSTDFRVSLYQRF